MHFTHLNQREAGKTVFVVGAGPQLATLSPRVLAELSSRATIGVNLTQYKVRPRYFISSYIEHHILAHHREPSAIQIHIRTNLDVPVPDYVISIKRRRLGSRQRLTAALGPPEPVIFSRRNVAFAATHLALILGAGNVVYVGVEQDNTAHYYTYDRDAREAIREDLERFKRLLRVGEKRSQYDVITNVLNQTPAELEAQPFHLDHETTFREYFRQLEEHGISVYSATEQGVANRAGARYLPIDECLALP